MVFGCEIIFDRNEHGVYFSGQMLGGRVNITLTKPKRLKGVRIQIAGHARTRWNERVNRYVNGRPQKKDIFYQADETFLDSKASLDLFRSTDDGSATDVITELPAGQHTYTFACPLPSMLPTSFEGTYGHIRYTVKVVLERPWKFDQTYKVAFTVLKELDLNVLSPVLRIPTQMETSDTFWCGPCTSGQLSIVASIPQGGYVPGQNIAITADVSNMSNVPVNYMRFSLRKIVVYKSHVPDTKTKLELDIVQERRTGHVESRDIKRFEVIIAIPPLPPTNTNLCQVMEIAYDVRVEAKVSGLHTSPFLLLPVTIGTVPLNRNTPNPKTPSIVTARASALPICEQPSPTQDESMFDERLAAPPLYEDAPRVEVLMPPTISRCIAGEEPIRMPLSSNAQHRVHHSSFIPPPSYEESVQGNYAIDDEDSDEQDQQQRPIARHSYTPRYVTYNFDSHPNQQLESFPISPAFNMTLSEERRNIYLGTSLSRTCEVTLTLPDSTSSAENTSTLTVGNSSGMFTEEENERHAAKLRSSMDTWL